MVHYLRSVFHRDLCSEHILYCFHTFFTAVGSLGHRCIKWKQCFRKINHITSAIQSLYNAVHLCILLLSRKFPTSDWNICFHLFPFSSRYFASLVSVPQSPSEEFSLVWSMSETCLWIWQDVRILIWRSDCNCCSSVLFSLDHTPPLLYLYLSPSLRIPPSLPFTRSDFLLSVAVNLNSSKSCNYRGV